MSHFFLSFLPLAQVRRKALQEEIDRESGKTEASGTQTWTVSAMPALFEAVCQCPEPFPPGNVRN